jgi:hypothetical protein
VGSKNFAAREAVALDNIIEGLTATPEVLGVLGSDDGLCGKPMPKRRVDPLHRLQRFQVSRLVQRDHGVPVDGEHPDERLDAILGGGIGQTGDLIQGMRPRSDLPR